MDLTVEEVAARLRVHPETIRVWLRRGKLRGYRLPSPAGWRVREEDLEQFKASRGNE